MAKKKKEFIYGHQGFQGKSGQRSRARFNSDNFAGDSPPIIPKLDLILDTVAEDGSLPSTARKLHFQNVKQFMFRLEKIFARSPRFKELFFFAKDCGQFQVGEYWRDMYEDETGHRPKRFVTKAIVNILVGSGIGYLLVKKRKSISGFFSSLAPNENID